MQYFKESYILIYKKKKRGKNITKFCLERRSLSGNVNNSKSDGDDLPCMLEYTGKVREV